MTDNEKPENQPPAENRGAVPSLEGQQRYGAGRKRGEIDDEIERELQEALGDQSIDQMLADPTPRGKKQAATPGRLKGRIISVHGQDVFVEVPGGRSQGVLPLQQFPEGPPKIGDEVEVTIEGAQEGSLLLSRKGAVMQADWSSVTEGMIVEARVTATNKGGLSVEVNGIRGFMPISQIDLYRVEDTEQYVNQKLRCMVAEVNPEERNLVVSRRALLDKEREEVRAKVWEELAEGQVRQGIVRSVRDFGAFVDIGGVDGLLPISQLSWSRVQKVEDVVKEGQPVKVVILKLDRVGRKVSLGLKQLTASPWDNIQEKYPAGHVVTGKVSRLADFGAFVELEPAVEGLIHISELAPQRVHRVKDIVQVGQEVKVLVLSTDPAQRRMSLSLKAALAKETPPEEGEVEEEYTPPPPRPYNPNLRGGVGGRP
jgi:small subunit ribosomal protein S1